MRKLVVNKKSGFIVKDVYKPVVIRDERGILFYSTEDLLPRTKSFNLPCGTYFVDSGFFVSGDVVKYSLIKLPPSERWFYPSIKNFDLQFVVNPSKCSIDWNRKIILMDHSFREKSWPIIDFILSHEIGHKFYSTEDFADLFAANRMIIKGYNPSQIGYAQMDSLSSRNEGRKNLLFNKVIESYDKTRERM